MYDVGRPPAFLLGRSGLGARGSGLGAGEEHLGPGETLAQCPEPVSTSERDELLNRIKGWTYPAERQHFVEGHPDVGAVFDDIVNRLRGLEERPKLLRCSKEARDRAHAWLGQLEDLGWKVRSEGPFKGGFTRVLETFPFTVFRGPTYTIRAISGAPPGSTVSSAPPGSVVVGGQAFPSSQAAAAAPEAGVVPTSGGASAFIPPSLSTGSLLEGGIAGIPTRYLVYGGLALLAWRMVAR